MEPVTENTTAEEYLDILNKVLTQLHGEAFEELAEHRESFLSQLLHLEHCFRL